MNNQQLKADKDRVLAELNFIKNELHATLDEIAKAYFAEHKTFAKLEGTPFTINEDVIEDLRCMGVDVSDKGQASIKTPGGHFAFPVHRFEAVIELVKKYYPADLLPYGDVYLHPSGRRAWWNPKGMCRMPGPSLYFPMPEQDNIHNFNTALKSGNKGLIELFAKALDAGQVARFTKDFANA